MSRGPWIYIACAAVALVPAARAAEDDPVRVVLKKAKATYEVDLEEYRKSVAAWFDKREETARKNGDKKVVDQVKIERRVFDEKNGLPKTAPAALKSRLTFTRSALKSAYAMAVREYTKTKRDDEAAAVEKELKALGRVD